jgi:hypothetical protein
MKLITETKEVDKKNEKPEWLKHTLFELVQTLPNVQVKIQRNRSDE